MGVISIAHLLGNHIAPACPESIGQCRDCPWIGAQGYRADQGRGPLKKNVLPGMILLMRWTKNRARFPHKKKPVEAGKRCVQLSQTRPKPWCTSLMHYGSPFSRCFPRAIHAAYILRRCGRSSAIFTPPASDLNLCKHDMYTQTLTICARFLLLLCRLGLSSSQGNSDSFRRG